jgi:hypothetical protein
MEHGMKLQPKGEKGAVMKTLFTVVVAGLLAAITGCVTMPQTADEFRNAVPGALTGKVETFEVDRPFSAVAETFKTKGPECLNKTVSVTSTTPGQYGPVVSTYTVTYKPTVVVNKNRAELHVQHHTDNTLQVHKEPAGGYFLLVADAYPVGKNKTRVDLYCPAVGHKALIKAVKGWGTGENVGCPDLT